MLYIDQLNKDIIPTSDELNQNSVAQPYQYLKIKMLPFQKVKKSVGPSAASFNLQLSYPVNLQIIQARISFSIKTIAPQHNAFQTKN
jgi:hypothetical protein